MSSRKIRWLGLGLLATTGAGLLALTSMMNSAFAFGDDTALVMGPAAFRYLRRPTWTPSTTYTFTCRTPPSTP
jgi:hypothetical protein